MSTPLARAVLARLPRSQRGEEVLRDKVQAVVSKVEAYNTVDKQEALVGRAC